MVGMSTVSVSATERTNPLSHRSIKHRPAQKSGIVAILEYTVSLNCAKTTNGNSEIKAYIYMNMYILLQRLRDQDNIMKEPVDIEAKFAHIGTTRVQKEFLTAA